MEFKELLNIVRTVSEKDPAPVLKKSVAKCQEELGELVAAVLHEDGYKITDDTAEEIRANQLEEAVDVIVCMLSFLSDKKFTSEEIEKTLIQKVEKWNVNLEKRAQRIK